MKKESGENPERSGHCNWGGTSHHVTGYLINNWEDGRD